MAYHIGHPFVRLELGVFSLSCPWIYMQVRRNEKFWVMSITIYQNSTHVHPGERRGAHRKILTKILIFFISIHIIYIKLRQYHFMKKFLQVAGSILQYIASTKERKTYRDIKRYFPWYSPFTPTSKLYHNIFALSNIVGSIFQYITVSCCILL